MTPRKEKLKNPKACLYDRLPKQGQEKVDAFKANYNIYFKNQTNASEILKISQSAMYRYLAGQVLVPMEVANRFSIFTNGVVTVESIFFDLNEYIFDQKKAKKLKESNVIKR